MAHQPIEKLDVFILFEEVADWVWDSVITWRATPAFTIGRQLIDSVDSINANLVEGDGRYGTAESIHFFVIARGSARESRLWIQRAVKRKLVPASEGEQAIAKLERATVLLNKLINYRRGNIIREESGQYSPLRSATP